jgi:hypothetical protein
LVSNFTYKKILTIDNWINICGYMKKLCFTDSNEIDQLIMEISNLFEKKALRGFQNKFRIE